jgi:acyl-coenzyme A synthetase/AMP-(fatty) acid ligase
VLPTDVEAALSGVPEIREIAVVGVANEEGLLEVVACVVADGSLRHEDVDRAIGRAAAERLPRHKRPGRVIIVDALPRTPTGKLQRKVLQERLHREVQTVAKTA